ncbi:ATP-dependent DNA helicase RecG [Skermania sp. ID1734]|uniref:ATP-dependent DNA helicase RecG n=1 Tax=Skermania sp. ID1734 TaxID=2597516 RepID=UPI0011803328|nr:ATP-dependent DNA helicase RecG [Skermania sp. ID1734]TSE01047.1 ATP-dependent DNA helicase RecG [Skermania sp. ID1734]
MATLTDRLDHLLGARAAKRLAEELDIHTVEDLLRHYPHRYAEQGQSLTEEAPEDGARITIIGRIVKAQSIPMRNRNGSMLKVVLSTENNQNVHATFFNANRVQHNVKTGRRAMFSGTVKTYRGQWSLTHPGYLILPESTHDFGTVVRSGGGDLRGFARNAREAEPGSTGLDMSIFDLPMVPVYPATAKIESWDIVACVRQILDQLDAIDDPLPAAMRKAHGLIGLEQALRLVHLPASKADIAKAHERLRFDEALAVQLLLAQRRRELDERRAPAAPVKPGGIAAAFDEMLPFELTAGQHEVAAEISADLARPHPMHRLLQGEVGSGKTIVALRAMLQVIDNGYQCALLAPTEVLAVQHYRSLRNLLGPLGQGGELGADEHATGIALLTGSMITAAKRETLLRIVSGDAGIVIGTHALLQETVEFHDLGMVIVDEQHRFGVEQRDALRSRARAGLTPHLLVMTATPIPRTIAMTMLGDLVVSTLRELPAGRTPIVSRVVPAGERPQWVERAWERIREEVAAGRQAYVVCSRIGDEPEAEPKRKGAKGSKDSDSEEPERPTVSVLDLFDALRTGPLRGLRVGLLHGRLPGEEKDAVMRDFTAGQLDVLVCTTVIEVGVDVPNATVMVVVDADRFGVSQLHQLRGRVGRGRHEGLCILVSGSKVGSPSMTRLEAVAGSNDGFELAQLDLVQRREGDVLGAAQSGTVRNLRLLSLLEHVDIIVAAKDYAEEVVSADPQLARHRGLASMVRAALDQERVEYLSKA